MRAGCLTGESPSPLGSPGSTPTTRNSSKPRRVKRKHVLAGLFLAILLVALALVFLRSSPPSTARYYRGTTFETYSYPNGTNVMTSGLPRAVWNGSSWVNYIYTRDSAENCYHVQTAYMTAEVYDAGYVLVYDPNMTTPLLNETWGIMNAATKANVTLGPWTHTVITNSSGVYVNASETVANVGTVSIIFDFQSGLGLKHTFTFESAFPSTVILDIKQTWKFLTNTIQCVTVDGSKFNKTGFYNGTNFVFGNNTDSAMLIEDQSWSVKNGTLQPTSVNFASGLVTYLFGNYTVSNGSTITIDPTTYSQDPGASGNDGCVRGHDTNYATAHGTADQATSTQTTTALGQQIPTTYYYIFRGFLKYDTSSISSGATISAAKLCLYGDSDASTTDFVINLQKWTGDAPIGTGSYNQFDGTNYDDGTFSTSSFSTSGYNNITISNFGLITKAGNTLICVRSSRDVSSTVPTGDEYVVVWSYDKGAGYLPLLEVTYTTTDITAPTYSSITQSSMTQGTSCTFGITWNDNVALSKYMFGCNVSGSWVNSTNWIAFGSTPQTITNTTTLSASVGDTDQYEWWANDTSNNFANTGLQNLTTIVAGGTNWWNTNFGYRIKITFNNAAISETLTNFPMPVVFSSSQTSFWSHVNRTTGSDVRFVFSDNTSELYFEVEKFDTTNNASVWWVKTNVTASSTTDFIWLYYGNNTCAFDSYNAHASVWDSNYVMVQHMTDLTTSTTMDSTSNGYNGTKAAANKPATNSSGQIDGAQTFSTSSTDYIYGSITIDLTKNVTASAWVDFTSFATNTNPRIFEIQDASYSLQLIRDGGSTDWGTKDSNFDPSLNGQKYGAPALDTWYNVAVFWDATNKNTTFWINGAQQSNTTTTSFIGVGNQASKYYIGVRSDLVATSFMQGAIDELEVSKIGRSQNWIKAEYQYEVDQSKFTYAAEESCPFTASITVTTSTHTWTIAPGQNNVTINENSGYIILSVTANGAFDIGAKASGDLTYGAYSISLTYTNMSATTWASAIPLTASYQTVPGLSNVASGTGLTENVILWLSCPTNEPAGAYTFVITFEIIQHGGSY